jgi:TATA-box binding protein (TBP) (component of TFIID and TFIIIB)
VVNIVGLLTLVKFDVRGAAKVIPNAIYRAHGFPPLVVRISTPVTASFNIFPSRKDPACKAICTGTKSERDLHRAADQLMKILTENRLVPPKSSPQVDVVNIVTLAEIDAIIDLDRLALKLHNIIYEPSQFPGALCFLPATPGTSRKRSFLIYKNGKIVHPGAESIPRAQQNLKELIDQLDQLRVIYRR